jgi:2-polyprenyl-3-methyl-5-hydroxy-6-metoxy-1,4-benzoquinol methylase
VRPAAQAQARGYCQNRSGQALITSLGDQGEVLLKMPIPAPEPSWPESWRLSYRYDQMELWGHRPRSGYGYAYKARRDAALRLALTHKPPPARVLDLAAAQGNFSIALAERGYHVAWNDLREELIDYVKMKKRTDLSIQFMPGDAFNIQGAFDLVLATEIIEHVAHVDQFLKKLRTLLVPDGIVVLTTPNGLYVRNNLPRFSDCPDPSVYEGVQFKPDSDGHIFLLHPDELRSLAAKAGLQVLCLRTYTNPLTAGHMKLHHLLHMLPERAVLAVERVSASLPRQIRERLHTNMAAVLTCL